MDFLKRILKTKKIQKAKEIISEKADDIKKNGEELLKKADQKFEISEKFVDVQEKTEEVLEDVKEKASEINQKFNISKKAKKISESVEDMTEKAGKKIESILDDKISFDTFMKVEIKVGKVMEAEPVKKSEKLLKLSVNFGDDDTRQIISGIAKWYTPDEIIGKKAVFVTNLEPRKIMGLESNGMILGVSNENNFSILSPERSEIEAGTRAG